MNMTPTEHYEAAVALTNKASEDHGTGHSGALVTAVRGLAHAILADRPATEPQDKPASVLGGVKELTDSIAGTGLDDLTYTEAAYIAEHLWNLGYRPTWIAPQAVGL